MHNEFYYRLTSLPLFVGLTREDALNMAGQARFDFRKPKQGELIVFETQECSELIFTIQGKLRSSKPAPNGSYTIEEFFSAPTVLQPERLFGRRPRYTCNIYAESDDVQILVVRKQDVRDILFNYMPFHLNYLNYICSCQQLLEQRVWLPEPQSLRERFVRFVQMHCEQMAGRKRIITGMNELAIQLNTTRLNTSRLLHELEAEELLFLQRGVVDIPAVQRLITSLY